MKSILAIETSTNFGSVAVIDHQGRLATRESTRQRSHSEFIHPAITDCLTELSLNLSDLDVLAVGQGPGSFTGIRVAGNAIKALAWSLKRPLVAIDSLSILARGTPVRATPLHCTFNAFRNMLYYASFSADRAGREWVLNEGPVVLTPEEWEARIQEPCLCVGDALEVYESALSPRARELLKVAADLDNHPKASVLAQWVFEKPERVKSSDWKDYAPLYIRSTDSLFKKQRP